MGSKSFNADIGEWDTSVVTNMDFCEYTGETNFHYSSFDFLTDSTPIVHSTNAVFYQAISFHVNISGWDMSAVTTKYKMYTCELI